ncbi:MAG: hypothetical protein AAFR13_03610 [Pseudomonadota bacterium]
MRTNVNSTQLGRWMRPVAIAGFAVTLTGCVINTQGPSARNVPVGPTFAEGSWTDSGRVATASLINGSFVSVANDTGNRVAEGSYVYTGANSISLQFFSQLRQTQVSANCLLAGQTTLNCTNSGGQQFQLFKTPVVS